MDDKVIVPKKKKMKGSTKLFIIVMLAFPIIHLTITWLIANVQSVMLVFQKKDFWTGEYEWAGTLNLRLFFNQFKADPNASIKFTNSLLYMPITCLISVPTATFFSYCLFKKMPAAPVFRVIFFLPNVIPVVALTMAFRLSFDPGSGWAYELLRSWGSDSLFFGGEPSAQIMIFIYCIWAGLGYDIILLSGAMGRIPDSVLESARLDGVGFFREFIQFVVPLIWPTLITLNILGMTTVLTLYLQPYLLTGGKFNTGTIAMYVFNLSQTGKNLETAATTGLLCSLVWAPIVLGTRKFMSRFFKDIDY